MKRVDNARRAHIWSRILNISLFTTWVLFCMSIFLNKQTIIFAWKTVKIFTCWLWGKCIWSESYRFLYSSFSNFSAKSIHASRHFSYFTMTTRDQRSCKDGRKGENRLQLKRTNKCVSIPATRFSWARDLSRALEYANAQETILHELGIKVEVDGLQETMFYQKIFNPVILMGNQAIIKDFSEKSSFSSEGPSRWLRLFFSSYITNLRVGHQRWFFTHHVNKPSHIRMCEVDKWWNRSGFRARG